MDNNYIQSDCDCLSQIAYSFNRLDIKEVISVLLSDHFSDAEYIQIQKLVSTLNNKMPKR